MKIFTCTIFWEAMAAIGTVGAVIVSLYLANRKEKPCRKLEVCNMVKYLYDEGIIVLYVTVDNVGNRPIVIKECGKLIRKNVFDTTFNKYLTNPFRPQILEVGKAFVLEYKYMVGMHFDDNSIENDEINIAFSEQNFGVEDTRGIIHRPKF